VQISFCQNFVKFPPIFVIFSRKIAKRLKLCKVHSISISPNSHHHTIMSNADVPNCYTMLKVVICNKCPLTLPACVPQLFEQLINTTLCPVFLRKFVCQPFHYVLFQIQIFLSKPCPHRLISCWLLTNTALMRLRWWISDATNWSPQ